MTAKDLELECIEVTLLGHICFRQSCLLLELEVSKRDAHPRCNVAPQPSHSLIQAPGICHDRVVEVTDQPPEQRDGDEPEERRNESGEQAAFSGAVDPRKLCDARCVRVQGRNQIVTGSTESAIERKARIGEGALNLGAQVTRLFAFHLLATPLS